MPVGKVLSDWLKQDVVVQRRNLNALARKTGAMKQWEEESG
jgi:hypothetical protein